MTRPCHCVMLGNESGAGGLGLSLGLGFSLGLTLRLGLGLRRRLLVWADMEFVQNFTPPDFQVKNFTPPISTVLVRKNTKN